MTRILKPLYILISLQLAACGSSGDSNNTPNSTTINEALNNALTDPKLVDCIDYTGELIASLPAGETDFDKFVRDTVWAVDCSSTSPVFNFSYVNQITSIQGLDQFTNISYINLANNYISDISPLFNMTTLSHVDLRNTPISCDDIYNLREWINSLEGELFDSCE